MSSSLLPSLTQPRWVRSTHDWKLEHDIPRTVLSRPVPSSRGGSLEIPSRSVWDDVGLLGPTGNGTGFLLDHSLRKIQPSRLWRTGSRPVRLWRTESRPVSISNFPAPFRDLVMAPEKTHIVRPSVTGLTQNFRVGGDSEPLHELFTLHKLQAKRTRL